MRYFLVLLFSVVSANAEIEFIDPQIECKYLPSTLKKERDSKLSIYIDESKNFYIKVDDVVGGTFFIEHNKMIDFRASLKKFFKWRDILKKEKLSTNKLIKDIKNDPFDRLNNLSLKIISYNNGDTSELILSFSDYSNKFRKGMILINAENALKLAKSSLLIDDTYEKLKKRIDKTDELLK